MERLRTTDTSCPPTRLWARANPVVQFRLPRRTMIRTEEIENVAYEAYEDLDSLSLFRDEAVDSRIVEVIEYDPISASVVSELGEMEAESQAYETEIVECRFIGEPYDTRRMYGSDNRRIGEFREQFRRSFTDRMHTVITDAVGTDPLDYDTLNEIPIEAALQGNRVVAEQSYSRPDSMLVSDTVASDILSDSVFDEWEPIANDVEQQLGIDVYRDDGVLYGNEILLVDTDTFGVQYLQSEMDVQEKPGRVNAGIVGDFFVSNSDAGVRLTI